MKPTQYYYAFKKISSKYPIAGTAINTELELIRKHEKRLLDAEDRDKAQLKSRRVTLDRSIHVAKKLVNIQSKSQLTDLKHLDRVVTEKSERLARLRYGPSKNSDMETSLGDMFDYVRKGNHSMAKRFLLGTPDNFTGINAGFGSIGNTVLHIATGKGDVTMLKILLKFGADPNIRNKLGKVPLHIAWSSWLTAPFFMKSVKKVEAETCIEFLLQFGADPTIPILHNLETPLHTAARFGNAKVVSRLLSFGSKPLFENSLGETPLDVAAKNGYLEAVRIMANWPSVLKALRVSEIRSKWAKFLADSSSSLASTPTVDSVLLNEKTKVQHQIAMNRQMQGAVKVSFETYLLFDKEPGKFGRHATRNESKKNEADPDYEESRQRWLSKKKRAAAERNRKMKAQRGPRNSNLKSTDDSSIYKNKAGIGSRPSAMLFKKKMITYDSAKRFVVKQKINLNTRKKSMRMRRQESVEATISDPHLKDRPAFLSPIKTKADYDVDLNPSDGVSNNASETITNNADEPTYVTYNDPRSLPPKKTLGSPEVLPKPSSVEYKLMPHRKKIAGVFRLDWKAGQGPNDKSRDPWSPAKTAEEIEANLSYSSAIQL